MAAGETSATIMSAADREILEKNRTNIREVLDVEDVLVHLTDKKLIDNKDCKILLDNKLKAPDVLIDLLLENRTSAALREFVVALRKARRYGTLVYVLGQESSGSDDTDDTDGEREDTQPQKTEKYYKNKIKKLIMKNKTLKDQLAHEKQEKKKLENMVTELVKRSTKKDKKIIELRTQIQQHENRIQDLEERLAKGNKVYEDNFADHKEQLGALTERLNNLDTNRPVFVGNVGTAIQTHVHSNPEDSNNPGMSTPVSSQPYEDRSYLNNRSRRLPHLIRQASTTTPRTPRSAKSKKKQ